MRWLVCADLKRSGLNCNPVDVRSELWQSILVKSSLVVRWREPEYPESFGRQGRWDVLLRSNATVMVRPKSPTFDGRFRSRSGRCLPCCLRTETSSGRPYVWRCRRVRHDTEVIPSELNALRARIISAAIEAFSGTLQRKGCQKEHLQFCMRE